MFGLLECQPVLGYDRSWLVLDLRMQCNDQAYFYFGMVALFTLTVYSTGMPVWFLVTLQQRRQIGFAQRHPAEFSKESLLLKAIGEFVPAHRLIRHARRGLLDLQSLRLRSPWRGAYG